MEIKFFCRKGPENLCKKDIEKDQKGPTKKIFPHFVSEMTLVAEETGNLEEMFNFMADCFEEEFNYSVDQLLEMLEPGLVIVIGCIIGFILLALYLPIFKMGQII